MVQALQSNSVVSAANVQSVSQVFANAQTAGSTNLAIFIGSSSNNLLPATVTDTAGNTYTQVAIYNGGLGGSVM